MNKPSRPSRRLRALLVTLIGMVVIAAAVWGLPAVQAMRVDRLKRQTAMAAKHIQLPSDWRQTTANWHNDSISSETSDNLSTHTHWDYLYSVTQTRTKTHDAIVGALEQAGYSILYDGSVSVEARNTDQHLAAVVTLYPLPGTADTSPSQDLTSVSLQVADTTW